MCTLPAPEAKFEVRRVLHSRARQPDDRASQLDILPNVGSCSEAGSAGGQSWDGLLQLAV